MKTALKTSKISNNGHNRIGGVEESKPNNNGTAHTAAPTEERRTAKAKKNVIEVVMMRKELIQFRIIGDTPLIVHQFSAKERQRMLDNQMGKPNVAKKEPKDPVECFKNSLYRLPDNRGFGIPARAFKAAAVTVSNDIGLMKTQMKRAIRVLGPDLNPLDVEALIPIVAPPIEKPVTPEDEQYWEEIAFERSHGASMRQDIVRLESGVADIRFRAWFPIWSCMLQVTYNAGMLSEAQVLALFEAAGFGSGAMEWRPSAPHSDSGQYGCWAMDQKTPIARLNIEKR